MPSSQSAKSSRSSALSPSRLNTYVTCPLQYRLSAIDAIPSAPTQATVKGTLVHSVLEDLFDEPRDRRTMDYARSQIAPHWQTMVADDDQLRDTIFHAPGDEAAFLEDCAVLVNNYFHLENPVCLEPAHREKYVRATTPEGIHLHGYMDRVDIAADGQVRIIDYKTGKTPRPRYIEPYNFQLEFYALMWNLSTGQTPRRLQLLFLRDANSYYNDPTDMDIDRARQRIVELWTSIKAHMEKRYFPPRQNPLCNWCDYQKMCPVFGGETPPLDEERVARHASIEEGLKL